MLQSSALYRLTFFIFVTVVNCIFHKYIRLNSTIVKYENIFAYHEEISAINCVAICDGHENCTSVNYNVITMRCELTPYLPWIEQPADLTETSWRIYYNDRIVPVKTAWQNSTYIYFNGALNASYAIDGSRDNIGNASGLYCAHTNNPYSYWAVEFKQVVEVESVILLFRNNLPSNYRNKNLTPLISSTREDCDNNNGTECAFYAGPPVNPALPVKVMCTQPVIGKFLKIIQNSPTAFTLCEVEVYSV